MKKSYKIQTNINPIIKVGDKVKLIDGSSLTLLKDDDTVGHVDSYFIINSYPYITGIGGETLKESIALVTEANIKDRICISSSGSSRIQDIVIQIGKAKFRTCSEFVISLTNKSKNENAEY